MTRLVLMISLISVLLHGAWEWAQCRPFFEHETLPPTPMSMLRATIGDVVLTWIAYAVVATVSNSWFWIIHPLGRKQWLTLTACAVIFGFAIEAYALHIGKWSYRASALLIPGTRVAWLPILQLLFIFPLTFSTGRWIAVKS